MNVWTVHATLAEEVRPTQAIYRDEKAACNDAAALSRDDGVLAASVVRFTLDELGTRANVAIFVAGERHCCVATTARRPVRDRAERWDSFLIRERIRR
ncbi:hypothetical protein ACTXG6_19795 [Pseudonocardia sp. Cha107L01]|uniref:hypothetical protein n=1 Tax=Pseudonocardia sp. Cha107L01 TaxID=3457576 RepID=UPI00403E6BF6